MFSNTTTRTVIVATSPTVRSLACCNARIHTSRMFHTSIQQYAAATTTTSKSSTPLTVAMRDVNLSTYRSLAAQLRNDVAQHVSTALEAQKTVADRALAQRARNVILVAQTEAQRDTYRPRYCDMAGALESSQVDDAITDGALALQRGVVVRTVNKKTVAVRVARTKVHELTRKPLLRHHRLQVHDEFGDCVVGDVVDVARCPRISATKTHELFRIVSRAPRVHDEQTGDVVATAPAHFAPDKYDVLRTRAGIVHPLRV